MRVGQVPGITGVYNKQGASKVEKAKEVQGKRDAVSISGSGQDYNTVMKALKDIPEVRMDRVEELSQKFESGTYNVDDKEIVDKMVDGIVNKKV